jgi:hypothetical protein
MAESKMPLKHEEVEYLASRLRSLKPKLPLPPKQGFIRGWRLPQSTLRDRAGFMKGWDAAMAEAIRCIEEIARGAGEHDATPTRKRK